MKIKLSVKCYDCNREHDFEFDTEVPYCFITDTDCKLALIDIKIVEEDSNAA